MHTEAEGPPVRHTNGVTSHGTLRSVFVTAFAPADSGNGSAMRAQRWRRALERLGPTHVLMIPVAGMAVPSGIATISVPSPDEMSVGAVELAMDPRWRRILATADPVPAMNRAAPPWLGRRAADRLPWRPDVVVAFKAGVAPVALDLAWAVGAEFVLDLDDDEVEVLRALGHESRAAAAARLRAALVPFASAVCVAAPTDATRLTAVLGCPVAVVPNAVQPPTDVPPPAPPSGDGRPPAVAFVGNFTYEPNVDGLRWFVGAVLALVSADVRLVVVGSGGREALGGLSDDSVSTPGAVADLGPFYRDATLVICPLRIGSGTRLKILEAMGWARPVVSTTLGAAGLGLRDGHDILIADEPAAFADAIDALVGEPGRARMLGLAGRREVLRAHTPAVTEAAVASLLQPWESRT